MNIIVIVALVFIGLMVWVAVKNRWATSGTPSSTAFSSGGSWDSSSSDSGSGNSGGGDCSSDGGGSDGGGGGDGGCD